MRTSLFVVAISLMASCGGGSRQQLPRQPLGVQGNLSEAQRHDADARRHDEIAAEAEARAKKAQLQCSDRALDNQLTSGGERLLARSPCWSNESDTVERHKAEAARLRADADAHRERARKLLDAEQASCAGMPPDELGHTPFAHKEDVAAVVAELDGDVLRGARIRFKKVPGLTVDWLREAIACHQARAAALGWDPTYMSYDPAMVAGAEVSVIDGGDGAVVVVTSSDEAAATIAYQRAEELLE